MTETALRIHTQGRLIIYWNPANTEIDVKARLQISESRKSFSGMILMPSISAVEYSSKVITNFG